MTPEGELIGGVGDPAVTMHIENAALSPSHCEIRFEDRNYKLMDAGSVDGTWVKIFDLDLYQESRKRVYRIQRDIEFTITETKDKSMRFLEVENWLNIVCS